MTEYNWLPQTDYDKAIGQFRLQVLTLLADVYSMHGYKDYAPSVTAVIVELAEQYGKRVRGKDVPIQLPLHIIKRIKEEL